MTDFDEGIKMPAPPDVLSFALPFPPTVNHYYRRTNGGKRVVLTERGVAYRSRVRALVKGDRLDMGLTGRLTVHVSAHMPDQKVRDLDNLLKALLDSMEKAGVYKSDGQIDDLRITRVKCSEMSRDMGGLVTIRIWEHHDDEPG